MQLQHKIDGTKNFAYNTGIFIIQVYKYRFIAPVPAHVQ